MEKTYIRRMLKSKKKKKKMSLKFSLIYLPCHFKVKRNNDGKPIKYKMKQCKQIFFVFLLLHQSLLNCPQVSGELNSLHRIQCPLLLWFSKTADPRLRPKSNVKGESWSKRLICLTTEENHQSHRELHKVVQIQKNLQS